MKNDVTICHKNNCISANGKNAEIITIAMAFMFILTGIAAIIRATNN